MTKHYVKQEEAKVEVMHNGIPKRIKTIFVMTVITILLLPGCSDSGRTKPPKASYHAENEYMQMAIDEARDGIYNGDGGPL